MAFNTNILVFPQPLGPQNVQPPTSLNNPGPQCLNTSGAKQNETYPLFF